MERCWTFLLLLVPFATCEDIVAGNVSESREDQSSSQSMPENIAVNVTITGQDVQLDLTLDLSASTDIPVYVFSRNKDGQLDTERVNRKINKHFAVYRDVTQGAVFSVRRDVDTGHGQLTLEGVVHVKGKVYDLKSTKRRHRNSTNPTSDGKTGSVGHDVQRRDVNDDEEVESNQTEAADNHEFIVRLLDDLPPRSLRGDAILPPTSLQKKVNTFQGDDVQQLASLQAPAAPISNTFSVFHDVYIDVIAVADYGVFSNWYANSFGLTEEEKTQDVLDKLPQHYAFMFSGANMIYESITSLPYTIHIKMSSLLIATHPADSPWTESLRVKTSDRDRVVSTALYTFAKWVNTTDLVRSYNHLTLFSGYDLWETEGDYLGIAYRRKMCSPNGLSVSLVEDLPSPTSIPVLAHEIGHSLGSEHDGENNMCDKDDQFIMAPSHSSQTASNWHNLWTFSSCSIRYFRTFISETAKTTEGRQCLYKVSPHNNNIPDVPAQHPGQVYDHDAQCREIFGPSFRLCRGSEFYKTPQEVCMNLKCDDMTAVTSCQPLGLVAARGTSCGHHKWCVNGDCVYDTRAPAMDENCPFGDVPGLVLYSTQTCAELIASYPRLCYDKFYFSRCCASCAKYSRPVRGCQYGDRLSDCERSKCSWYSSWCCETCRTGMPFTIKSITTPSFPLLPGRGVNGICKDNVAKVRGKTCADLVASSPASCYDSHVTASCCDSCRQRSTGVKGCEFGDKNPSQCSFAIVSRSSCQTTLKRICCQTCAKNTGVPWGGLVTSSLTTWLWVVGSLLHRLLSY